VQCGEGLGTGEENIIVEVGIFFKKKGWFAAQEETGLGVVSDVSLGKISDTHYSYPNYLDSDPDYPNLRYRFQIRIAILIIRN
jgi:hypothetical protein